MAAAQGPDLPAPGAPGAPVAGQTPPPPPVQQRSWWRRWQFWLALVICVPLLVGLVFAGYVLELMNGAPPLSTLKPRTAGQTSIIYAADGSRLGTIPAPIAREPISERHVPKLLGEATVAIEDRRFYSHNGVDLIGLVRAAAHDVRAGGIVEGGSTLTMQLVRNLYIGDERSFSRKVREAALARELEKRRSKKWILTAYLNDVPYGTVGGQSAYGVQAASRMFFGGRPVWDLKLPQLALLAGLPQATDAYNPFAHPAAARARRNEVLEAMASTGAITRAEATAAERAPLGVSRSRFFGERRERYFFDFVRAELERRYGKRRVERGGLLVYTTIMPRLQRAARKAIAARLSRKGDPDSALVSIDPRSGAVRAMVSSADYEKTKFNYAVQGRRQPGSTFKPFVLAAALERGIDPKRTLYASKPFSEQTKFGPIRVQTYEKTYNGPINLVEATLRSDNTVYAQLDLDIGPQQVAREARKLGISEPLQGLPAEGLGGLRYGVSVLDLTRAYASFARGVRHDPVAISKVVFPGGKTDQPQRSRARQVLDPRIAGVMTSILTQNVIRGTGRSAGFGCPAAGKTGTTTNFRDAWFAGYTPDLTTSVWVGYGKSGRAMTNVHGIAVAGATFPAQIWRDYMARATAGRCRQFPREPWPPLRPYCQGHAITRRGCPLRRPQTPVVKQQPRPEQKQKSDRRQAQQQAPSAPAAGQPPPPAIPAPNRPAPDTTIDSGPRGSVSGAEVEIYFSSPSPGTSFECQLNGQGFNPCNSPARYQNLAPGDYSFDVRAVGSDGQRDQTPARADFTVSAEQAPPEGGSGRGQGRGG